MRDIIWKRSGAALALVCLLTTPVLADGGVTFTDIATDPASGIVFARTPSARVAGRDALTLGPPIPNAEFFPRRATEMPQKAFGAPGVAVFDYDGDGDLDIYATNGPGGPNSLFQNQLRPTGQFRFVDMAAAAGVTATAQESSGVCFGDIDNDGDQDLYVLGLGEPNILFENRGDGTFRDITADAGVAGDGRHAASCAMGDVNNDGRLDIVVGNTFDNWNHRRPVFIVGAHYPGMEHNYLFMNQGGNHFTDESAARGIENVSNMAGPDLTGAAFTWAVALVDSDQDGDLDLWTADNQGILPRDPSEGRGWIRLFQNDGTGHFTDITEAVGTTVPGSWMGIDFADFNCDSYMDFFATDLGYIGNAPSQWFLGSATGVYTPSEAGDLILTPFGWGTSTFDYDNDGDSDIVWHGGDDILVVELDDNPGVVLTNEGACSADFAWDQDALTRDHRPRQVHGVAVGDLNGDGFEDIITIASHVVVPQFQFAAIPNILPQPSGSVFDDQATIELFFAANTNPGFRTYLHPEILPGDLAVEINSADNGNGWAEVTTKGTVGLTRRGSVNRDGIGAVVKFTPEGGPTSTRPILGGSSYASQDALAANFGLGTARQGTVDILWPGGVRNRLHNVRPGEKIVFPEIPCSIDETHFGRYLGCVATSIFELRVRRMLGARDAVRFFNSALRAFGEEN
jgi:hypothetical protein